MHDLSSSPFLTVFGEVVVSMLKRVRVLSTASTVNVDEGLRSGIDFAFDYLRRNSPLPTP